MKQLILILLSFLSFNLNAQKIDFSQQEKIIDSIFFNKINIYRAENGVPPILRFSFVDSLCNKHNIYQLKCQCATHSEFDSLSLDTVSGYKRLELINLIGVENSLKGDFIDKFVESGILHYQYKDIKYLNQAAIYHLISSMMLSWVQSPIHNSNLLKKDLTFGGISVKLDTEKEIMVADFMAFIYNN